MRSQGSIPSRWATSGRRAAAYLLALAGVIGISLSVVAANAATIWQPGATSMWYENTKPEAEAEEFTATTTRGEKEPVVVALWSDEDGGPVGLTVDFPVPVEIRLVGFQRRNIRGQLLGIPFWLWPRREDNALAGHENKATAGANVAWWLTVQAPDEAGLIEGSVTLHLERGQTISRPLKVRVLPIRLPRADIAFGLYFDEGRLPEYARTDEWKLSIYADMAEHGHTMVTFYDYGDWSQLPPKKSRMMHSLPLAKQAGLIHSDIPCMALVGGIERIAGDDEKVAWLQVQCEKNGWPELLAYGADEPNTPESAWNALPGFEKIHGHGMRTVTANDELGVGYLGELIDVWVLAMPRAIDSGVLKWAEHWGKEVWTYSIQHRATNARWNRQYAGLFTWGWGLRGNCPWAYTNHEKYAIYPDGSGTPGISNGFVLPTPEGIVTSVGWEGRREGIKDYCALQMLEKLLEGKQGPVVAQARQFLADTKTKVQKADFWHGHEETDYYWDRPDTHDIYADSQLDVGTLRLKVLKFIQDLQ